MKNKFHIGERVRFLNETGEGIVRGFINTHQAIVETNEGIEIPFLITELVKVMGEENIGRGEDQKKPVLEKHIPKKVREVIKKTRKNSEIVKEVDLHIEQIIDNFRGMRNGEIVQMQLSHCVNCLESAMRNRSSKIVFIHGVGNGVLKAEIRKVLDGYSNLEYHDASYAKYGFGATEVRIKY